jgi:hypothetical protein
MNASQLTVVADMLRRVSLAVGQPVAGSETEITVTDAGVPYLWG